MRLLHSSKATSILMPVLVSLLNATSCPGGQVRSLPVRQVYEVQDNLKNRWIRDRRRRQWPLRGSLRIGYLAPLLFSLKDADRDLLRLLLMTSAARVQIRSDVDGSWSRPTSFLRDRRGFPVSSVDFLGRHRRRPVLVSVVHANFLTHVSAKAASTALTCEDCGVRFISRLKYKIQAWRHVYDNVCIRLSLALVEAVLKKLALGK